MDRKEIQERMAECGIRPTANRISIALALARAGRPMSMGELETELDTIDKSGISRALGLFRSNHLVHVLEDGSDSVRYELCLSAGGQEAALKLFAENEFDIVLLLKNEKIPVAVELADYAARGLRPLGNNWYPNGR